MPSGEVLVRAARAGDEGAIADTLQRAFGRDDEIALVRQIHERGAGAVSLVAEVGGVVVGHALLSHVEARVDGRPVAMLALAPVGVRPTHQYRGIGGWLVETALARAAEIGAEAVVVAGDPSFYGRFGFSSGRARLFGGSGMADVLQAVEIVPGALSGETGILAYPVTRFEEQADD